MLLCHTVKDNPLMQEGKWIIASCKCTTERPNTLIFATLALFDDLITTVKVIEGQSRTVEKTQGGNRKI
jgi:hypothetical protein